MGYNQQVWRVWSLINIELLAAAPHDAKPLPTIQLSSPKPLPAMLSCVFQVLGGAERSQRVRQRTDMPEPAKSSLLAAPVS